MARKSKSLRVEEFSHCYLVRGTAVIPDARKALWKHLGKKKWSRIERMPARPLWTEDLGDARKDAESAVALYFNIGREQCKAPCCTPRDRYKP